VSLTLTKSHKGVSSATGTCSGTPMSAGRAQVSSSGGTNETSYWTVILRTSTRQSMYVSSQDYVPLEAVNRMALDIRLVTT